VSKNRQLLIGRSMGRNETREVLELLMQDPAVSYVTDTKTEEIGPGVFRFKADVGWDGATLAARYIERIGRDRLLQRLRAALKSPSPHEIDRVLQGYGKVGACGHVPLGPFLSSPLFPLSPSALALCLFAARD